MWYSRKTVGQYLSMFPRLGVNREEEHRDSSFYKLVFHACFSFFFIQFFIVLFCTGINHHECKSRHKKEVFIHPTYKKISIGALIKPGRAQSDCALDRLRTYQRCVSRLTRAQSNFFLLFRILHDFCKVFIHRRSSASPIHSVYGRERELKKIIKK